MQPKADDPAQPRRRVRLAMLRAKKELLNRRRHNRLPYYQPHPKQAEFHALGASKRERMLKAGNQQGKTLSAGAEVAMHLTGRYPDWWEGKRYTRPIRMWAAGVTNESTRDNPQRILLGEQEHVGTGWIPLECIESFTASRSCANAIDTVFVRHESGGRSILTFKSYEKGREKWQGPSLDIVWFDEEPPLDIYTEGLSRTNARQGITLITYTPLLGMSAVTVRFLKEASPDRVVVSMTIRDAHHYTEEQRAQIIASYPAHEREARVNGVPMMGSGRVFPLARERLSVDAFAIPDHWPRIAGIDFGWEHPTAGAWLAWDRDSDTVYVTDCYRQSQQPVSTHAAALKARGDWIPVAWPHDGHQHDKGSGQQLAEQYRDQGVLMLDEHAQFEPVSTPRQGETKQSLVSVEAGLAQMLEYMVEGRFRVFSHLEDWWEEFLVYHREDGKVVKEMDDLMASTRYGFMMLREARTKPKPRSRSRRAPNWRTG